MPKGVYKRTPGLKRNVSPEARAIWSENVRKARLKALEMGDTEKATAAKKRNAGKAVSIRTARAILKHLPLGSKSGDIVKVSQYRKLTVVDKKPVKRMITEQNGTERTEWEQKFTQCVSIKIYGQEHCFSGSCRIVWDYEPTVENIMDAPRFEEEKG